MSAADGTVGATTKILDNGPESLRWNFVILGDGYQQADLGVFAIDAANFVTTLTATAPLNNFVRAMNVYRVDVTSTDSGADDPVACGGPGTTAKTYFDATFCAGGPGSDPANSRRLLTVDSNLAWNTAKAALPNVNMAFVIVNSTVYGGSGGNRATPVAVFSRAAAAVEIGLHEMGHAAFGLADEYADPAPTEGGNVYTGTDAALIEPNVSAITDAATIRWSTLLTAGVAMPTTTNADCTRVDTQASPVATGTVGAFAGARYFHCGIYRPEYDCRMRTLGKPFCHVCSAVIATDLGAHMPGPPVVGSISPTAGFATGGTIVVITGSAFTGATAVNFGPNAAVTFNIDNDLQITAFTPPGTGNVMVTVTTPLGVAVPIFASPFTYTTPPPLPDVTAVNPATGSTAGGQSIVITGANFTGALKVAFGAVAATPFNVDSDTQITVTSPASGAGTVDVTVTGPSGTSAATLADRFAYAAPAPVVTGVSPAAGSAAGGLAVVIAGTGFTGATAVNFGAAGATFTVASDNTINATSPAGTGTVDVTVTTPAGVSGTGAVADQFVYAAAPPQVSGINPATGSPGGGDSIVLTGSGFTGATAAMFGLTAAPAIKVDSDTQMTVTSPAGTGTVDVTVTTPAGTSQTTAADQFVYAVAAPQISGIAPAGGSAGDSVVITGAGFTGATGVSFGGTAATPFTVNSDGQITVTSPAGSGTVDVVVTTPLGASAVSAADQFTYSAGGPQVTGLTPGSGAGAGGDSVVITGSGFTGASAVSFGANVTVFNVDSDTQITATSPAGLKTVDVTVTTPAGTSAATPADQFTYTTLGLPSVTSVSPGSGSSAGGDLVTITGIGFTGATDVTFGPVSASFSVDMDTQITATSPAGTGTVDIVVTTPSGVSAINAGDQFLYF